MEERSNRVYRGILDVYKRQGIPDEGYEHKKDMGTAITVRLDHAPVSVVILNDAIQFYEPEQYTRCGIVLKEYDVVAVSYTHLDVYKRQSLRCAYERGIWKNKSGNDQRAE